MKLTLEQRFALIQILPGKGDITVMGHVCTLRDWLIPSIDEELEFGVRQPDDTMRWDITFFRTTEREIEVDQIMTGRIKEELERLSNKGELLIQHVHLYRKFVKGGVKPAEETSNAEPETP
jgi:hypothetical protein